MNPVISRTARLFLLCLFIAFASNGNAEVVKKSTAPERLMILVFDQMRPDYIERFHLKNFKRLQAMGRNYKNAYVGHMGSVTIVSHSVISTGFMPKDLPWSDDVMVDGKNIFGKPGANYSTTHFSQAEILKALSTLPQDEFTTARLKDKLKKPIIAIGEKNYAAITMGGPKADRIITMGRDKGDCIPVGVNVPEYIVKNERFRVQCTDAYGTELSFYPLDGNHYFPGNDKKHLGGDVWTADLAIEVMKKEDWGGLFLTFGAIDKFGHMLGEPDGRHSLAFETPAHLDDIAKVADEQLGRILDELKKQGLLEKTLIISTADHGGQTDSIFLGNGGTQTVGEMPGEKPDEPKPFWISRIMQSGQVRAAYEDTAVRVWLKENTDPAKESVLKFMREIPQTTRIYELKNAKGKYSYSEVFNNLSGQPKKFQAWAKAHDKELLDTMANANAPTLVGLLADNAGFGKFGDHGGAQEWVQRIPMIIAGPGVVKGVDAKGFRLFDINAYVTKAFGLWEPMQGN